MVVQHNLTAMNANRYLGINNSKLSKSLEKLSSGYAINRAGDNAAGLAVSEKMRSQIAGLTQGVKNAQDGISMVQTYEGALTETDSILQRMKTLADQAANGTYQDDVDRDAIQLEFDQLNDELNQIADTDFNGVVCLNGGQMADGTKAVNGKFDYADGTAKVATKLDKGDVTLLDGQKWDTGTNAKTAWAQLNASWTRTDGQPATNGPDSVDITFKFDKSTNTWTATEANNGASVKNVSTTATTDGGFAVKFGTTEMTNVVINQDKLSNGDTITLTFNNPANKISAPTNAGADLIDTSNFTPGSGKKVEDADMTVAFTAANVTDAKWTEARNGLIDLFNGATIDVVYGLDTSTPPKADGKVDTLNITLTDGTKLALDAKADSTNTITANGTSYKLGVAKDTGVLTVTELKSDGSDGEPLLTITPHDQTTDLGSGTLSYKLGFENSAYDAAAKPSVEVKASGNVSKSNSNGYATAPLTYTDHVVLQAGARTKDSVDFTFQYSSNGLGDLKANMNCSSREDGLGTANLSLRTQQDANYAIDRIDNAINKVSMVRATFGAVQNRLEHKIDNMNVTIENITSAESGIRDTNMPTEMMNFTKQQILSQAAQSMLAQANQLPQSVLSLLQ